MYILVKFDKISKRFFYLKKKLIEVFGVKIRK